MLSINSYRMLYKPERCIRTTLDATKSYNFPANKIMFEFTEVEKIEDSSFIKKIVEYYSELGFITAVDDFGAGNSGLRFLSDFQINIIKLDMRLIRDIHKDTNRQIIIRNVLAMLRELNITALAEGIEVIEEMEWLRDSGVELMQGYLFAKPAFEQLPEVDFNAF